MKERSAAIQTLKEDPDCNVMIVSLKCGSLGLNLVCANHVILLDVWWNPAVEQQAIDRTHRIGQVLIYLGFFMIRNGVLKCIVLLLLGLLKIGY